jgi:hypothetical protein
LLFLQWRIGFIRRRLGFGALGFAQRSSLVLLSLFLLAPSTCRLSMPAGVTSRLWEIGDIVNVLEAFENRRTAA